MCSRNRKNRMDFRIWIVLDRTELWSRWSTYCRQFVSILSRPVPSFRYCVDLQELVFKRLPCCKQNSNRESKYWLTVMSPFVIHSLLINGTPSRLCIAHVDAQGFKHNIRGYSRVVSVILSISPSSMFSSSPTLSLEPAALFFFLVFASNSVAVIFWNHEFGSV